MNESNLSKRPPWPGIIVPESFIDALLLRIETITSPKNAKIIVQIVNKNVLSLLYGKKLKNLIMTIVKIIPTNSPLIVFPELIEGINFLPPINLPPK